MDDADEPGAGSGTDATPEPGDGSAADADEGVPDVPESPEAAVAGDDHAMPLEDLQYPEFTFEEGTVDPDGGFDLSRDLDREELREWMEELAGGLESHDVGIETDDRRVVLGVAPDGVDVSFDPDEDHVGEFAFTVRMNAKAMTVQDGDDPKVGARGGKGFVPLAMLDPDSEADQFRCYNWIDDPAEE